MGKKLSFASAIAVGLATIIRPVFGAGAVSKWTRAQIASEDLKRIVYVNLSGKGAPSSATEVATQTDEAVAGVADLQEYADGAKAKIEKKGWRPAARCQRHRELCRRAAAEAD